MDKFSDQFNQDLLVSEFKNVVSDAEALLKETADTGGVKLAEVRAKAERSLNNAKAKMAEIQTEVVEKTKAVAKSTDEYVHENPWRSIGFAASLGMVIGLLISRR